MKLQKYFTEKKIFSRRESERVIRSGQVKVNGAVIKDPVFEVDSEKDKIQVNPTIQEKITILFHKPRGISSSKVKSEGRNIFDLLPQFKDLNAIGRLDKESEGIILLSNNGILTTVMTGKDHLVEKEYIVQVQERVTPSKIKALSQGMILEDGPTLPAKARMVNDNTFAIILREGRNHQIRRMANKVRLTVKKLQRIRIGELTIKGLAPGEFRVVSQVEVDQYLKLK